jgi:hypothetical protein
MILLLGSTRGREAGPMLQKKLGTKLDIISTFKPNAPKVKDLKKLVKTLPSNIIML